MGLLGIAVLVLCAGFALNAWAKRRDVSRLSRGTSELIKRKEAIEAAGEKYGPEWTEVCERIDERIDLLEKVEERDPNPLR